MACGDDGDAKTSPAKASKPANLDQRCEQLGMACGDQGKHVGKLAEECAQAAARQVDKGCAAKAIAAYDCYEKELCGKSDKVWALDDFRVLVDRYGKCVAERNALRDCVDKPAGGPGH
jgi:hypothetical protein